MIFHALAQVQPIRDFFLLEKENNPKITAKTEKRLNLNQKAKLIPVRQAFGELMRKLHNRRAYRSHISPHETMQAVNYGSDKEFEIIKKSDTVHFIRWLVNSLHIGLILLKNVHGLWSEK